MSTVEIFILGLIKFQMKFKYGCTSKSGIANF